MARLNGLPHALVLLAGRQTSPEPADHDSPKEARTEVGGDEEPGWKAGRRELPLRRTPSLSVDRWGSPRENVDLGGSDSQENDACDPEHDYKDWGELVKPCCRNRHYVAHLSTGVRPRVDSGLGRGRGCIVETPSAAVESLGARRVYARLPWTKAAATAWRYPLASEASPQKSEVKRREAALTRHGLIRRHLRNIARR